MQKLTILVFILLFASASFAWYDSNYPARVRINLVNNTCNDAICPISIFLNGNYGNGSSGIFVNSADNATLNYWGEDGNFSSALGIGNIWVAVQNNSPYIYRYFNGSVLPGDLSNGDLVFLGGSSFLEATLNTSKWAQAGNLSNNSTAGGVLNLTYGSPNGGLIYRANFTALSGYSMIFREQRGTSDSMNNKLYWQDTTASPGSNPWYYSNATDFEEGSSTIQLTNPYNGYSSTSGPAASNGVWYFYRLSWNNSWANFTRYSDSAHSLLASVKISNLTIGSYVNNYVGFGGCGGGCGYRNNVYDFIWIMPLFSNEPVATFNTIELYNGLFVSPNSPANNSLLSNTSIDFSYAVNTTIMPVQLNALLFLDGVLLQNDTALTNSTFSHIFPTTQGIHSWYVFVYESANISRNLTSGINNFEVYFNLTAISPANNPILQGDSALLQYSTSNFYPINCTAYLDGSAVDTRILNSSSNVGIVANASSGSHSWFAGCTATDNVNYSKNSSILSFAMNYATYNNTLNLTSSPENVLASPQGIFYDSSGNLDVLYFTNDGPANYTLRIKTISNNSVTCAANLSLAPTSPFLLAMREANQTVLFSFNSTNSTTAELINFSSCALSSSTSSFSFSTAGTNTQYDAYTYANTRQYENLSLGNSSYYLFAVPLPNGTALFRKNISSGTLAQVGAQFPSNYAPAWQTIANSSTLSGWYYLEPNSTGAISLGYYNGSARIVLLTLDGNNYSAAQLNGSLGAFESFDGTTYAILANLSKTTIYQIQGNLSLQLSENIPQPSHFFFVDANTFLFFNAINGSTYAYSCYFAVSANCSKFNANEYGISMPYDRGPMTTAKRSGNSDVVAKGQISSSSVVQLLYNLNTYDGKYLCLNEMDESRLPFTVQIYTNTTANTLLNSSWGYVIPSAQLGPGLKSSYFTCYNSSNDRQPQRLFLSGLNANYTINAFSLNANLGTYYTFTITDAFGVPIQGAQLSAYRFSPSQAAYVVIAQGLTDSNGNAVLFLQPYVLYQLTIVQPNYLTLNFQYQPSGVTTSTIKLQSQNNPPQLPNFEYVWDNVSYSITPTTNFAQNSTNVTYQVNSPDASLKYYGMQITANYVNGSSAVVYFNNQTSSPSGGIISTSLNSTAQYVISTWFKAQNFSLYSPFAQYFTLSLTNSSFEQAQTAFNAEQPISGWTFYLIAIVCAMLAAGFVNKYLAPDSSPGAGLAALAVLWGFSLFNPNVPLVCAAGLAGACITPLVATAFTTLAVLAAVYIMGRY